MKLSSHTTRPQMAGYLAGAVSTAALLASQAEAAVRAVTFGFGTEYTAADGLNSYWTVGPGFGTLQGYAHTNFLGLGASAGSPFGSVYHNASYNASYGLPTFFTNGTFIGAGGNGAIGVATFQSDFVAPLNFYTDQLNKNIGFKTSDGNWGWANVSWTEATKTLAINEAWVESVANTPITIAAIPEPSRALLALAGLGGMALRRRRKQAA